MTYNAARRKPLTKAQRPVFLARNGCVCIYCKQPITEGQKWQDCHIIARELGGSDDWDNRGPGHVNCHKEDTRQVAALVAHSNRLIRKNGPIEGRRKTRQVQQPANHKWPKRAFQSRKTK
jgi:5-methylcytosine-specific restriction endonuclease McrA